MSQISPPMRIVLGVAVAFLAVYMIALRPKSASAPVPPAATPAGNVNTGKPAVTGMGKAVEAAKGAVAATEAQQTKEGRDAGVVPSTGDQSTTGSAAASKPAAKTPQICEISVTPRMNSSMCPLPRPRTRRPAREPRRSSAIGCGLI